MYLVREMTNTFTEWINVKLIKCIEELAKVNGDYLNLMANNLRFMTSRKLDVLCQKYVNVIFSIRLKKIIHFFFGRTKQRKCYLFDFEIEMKIKHFFLDIWYTNVCVSVFAQCHSKKISKKKFFLH